MRVLFASRTPFYPFRLGGAARCSHRLLLRLQARGHEVSVLTGLGRGAFRVPQSADRPVLGVRAIAGPDPWRVDVGYPVIATAELDGALAEALDARPDLVWSQLRGASEILGGARARGLSALWYLHDALHDAESLRAATAQGVTLVANSRFLARRVVDQTGVEPDIVYPLLDEDVRVEPVPDGFVTLVNPVPDKGVEVALDVAARIPEVPFLFVESWPLPVDYLAQLKGFLAAQRPNVTFWSRVADVRQFYARTRVLLVPSQWEETHGRVVREAQQSGIPVVASDRGGLPEAVGEGGRLVPAHSPREVWVEALRSVLADPGPWRARARAAAADPKWDPEATTDRFLEACARARGQ